MKKHLYLIIPLFLLAACTSVFDKNLNEDRRTSAAGDDELFFATIESAGDVGAQTKVYADEQMRVLWNAGDTISVFKKTTYNHAYRFTGQEGSNAGGFTKMPNDDEFITENKLDHYYAIYPYREETLMSYEGELTVDMPAVQVYKVNSFGIGANTMVSVTDDTQLQFKNAGGYLSFKFYGDGVSVKNITLKGNNHEKIAGKALITMPLGGVPSVSMQTTAKEKVSLICEEPLVLNANSNDYNEFWFVLPPTEFTQGFTVTVVDDKKGIFKKSTNKPVTISRNTLSRMAPMEIVYPKGSPYKEYTETSPFSVIGSLSNYRISWDADLEMWMTPDGTKHVAKCVSLWIGDEFKFRKDQDWSVNLGGEFGCLGEDFGLSQDGPNIKAPADGLYDLWLDLSAGTAMLTEAYQAYPDHKDASNWSVIGSLAQMGISWDNDIAMLTDGTTHVAQGIKLTAGDEFKFRKDKSWSVNLGGSFVNLDSDFTVIQDGLSIAVDADGIFDLIVNPTAGTARVVETLGGGVSGRIGGNEPDPIPVPVTVTGWNIIGANGDWENDILATPSQDNNTWTAYVTANEDTEFKWRKDGGWAENMGMATGATVTIGEPFGIEPDGPNVPLAAGFWKVVLDLGQGTMTIFPGDVWSLIGDFNGWAGDVDMVLTDGKWVSPATHLNENGFKLRYNHDWSINAGGIFVAFGTPFPVSIDTIMLPAEGDYIVTYNPDAQTIMVTIAQ